MHAIINNFRGIATAELDIAPVALLGGINGAGKTSIARAIAAALTGKPIPFAKITKKDCKVLLRHGTHAGSVTITTPEGMSMIEWPKADVTSTGNPPYASEIATGLTDILSMKEDDALAYFINLLKAAPDQNDLKKAFDEIGIDEKTTAAVWEVIKAQGWEAAHKQAVETGQKRKGAWQQVTGVNFGKKKIEDWYPEGWEDCLLQLNPEKLAENIKEANGKLEIALGKTAVSSARREELLLTAAKLDANKKAVDDHEKKVSTAQEDFNVANLALSSASVNSAETYACPHCEGDLMIIAKSGVFTVAKAKKQTAAEKKKIEEEYKKLQDHKSAAKLHLDLMHADLVPLKSALNDSVSAQKELEKVTDEEPAGESVEDIRKQLSTLQRDLGLLVQYQQAKKITEALVVNQKIVELLDEKGLRKRKLSDCMDAFMSSYIEPLCEDFGIPLVSIDIDLNVELGTTSYQLLSASEQFRVRTVLQIAIARLEKAALVIIDGADILDRKGREKLFDMIFNGGVPALICMTLNKPELAPDLATSGKGMTYWVEKSTCRPIEAARAA